MSSKSENANTQATSKPKQEKSKKSSSLPAETVEYLKTWMMSPEHVAHPYPTEQEKAKIMLDTGIELKQLTNWFVNNRKRYWKPRVEARLQQQAQAQNAAAAVAVAAAVANHRNNEANNGAFDVGMFAARMDHALLQPTPGPYIALDMTQPGCHQTSQIIPAHATTSLQHTNLISPGGDINAIRAQQQQQQQLQQPEHHQHQQVFHLFNNNEEHRAVFPSVTLKDNFYPPRSPVQDTPRAVSLGSASTFSSSDSDSNSTSNDDDEQQQPCSKAGYMPPVQGQLVTFRTEKAQPDAPKTPSVPEYDLEDETSSMDQIDENLGTVTRREIVHLHILEPTCEDENSQPSEKDVTILPSVPSDRVMKSFPQCELMYCFPIDLLKDSKKIQNYRDAAISQMKKTYLKLYLSEASTQQVGFHSAEVSISSNEGDDQEIENTPRTSPTPMKRIRSSSDFAITCVRDKSPIPEERSRSMTFDTSRSANLVEPDDYDHIQSSIKKRKTLCGYGQDFEQWRDACRKARHLYDESLPTLEEATHLFGYAN